MKKRYVTFFLRYPKDDRPNLDFLFSRRIHYWDSMFLRLRAHAQIIAKEYKTPNALNHLVPIFSMQKDIIFVCTIEIHNQIAYIQKSTPEPNTELCLEFVLRYYNNGIYSQLELDFYDVHKETRINHIMN